MAGDVVAKFSMPGLKEAEKGLDAVGDAADELGGDLADTRSKGQQAADAIKAGGDEVVAVLRAEQSAAEAFANALGPELAAKLGQGGIDEAIADFKRLGLTTEEVRADVDVLADAVRHLDSLDVGDAGLSKLDGAARLSKGGVDDLGKSADSSKSVLANMVGNSVQDLGTLGGVAGSAGVAIGQMGEYMVDAINSGDKLGNVLGNFSKIGGPIAALALITQGFAENQRKQAESAKFAADQQDLWNDAIEHGGDVAGNFAEALEKVGKIQIDTSKLDDVGQAAEDAFGGGFSLFPGAANGIEDITALFGKASIGAGEFALAVHDGGDALQAMRDYIDASNLSASEKNKLESALTQQVDAEAAAEENRARKLEFFGSKVKETQADAIAFGTALQGFTDANADRALDAVNESALRVGESTRSAGQAMRDLADANPDATGLAASIAGIGDAARDAGRDTQAFSDQLDSLFGGKAADLEHTGRAVLDSYDDLYKSFKKNGGELNASNEAGRENLDTLDKGVGAIKDFAQAQVENGWSVEEVTGALNDNVDALVDQAVKFGFNRKEVEAYIGALGLTPDNVTTAVRLANEDVAKQKIAEFKTDLESIPPWKAVDIQALIAEGSLQEAAEALESWARNHQISLDIVAKGGAGFALEGNAGHPASGGGSSTFNVTVPVAVNNSGPIDPYQLAQAVAEGVRRGLFPTGLIRYS